jgi:hypothetical protein
MVEQVISKIGQHTSRLAPNLFGAGLPDRIRTTIVAMVGFTAAAGLALVLFLSQTTWSIPSLGPLTFPPPGQSGLHGGVALGTDAAAPARSSSSSAAAGGASLAVVVPTEVAIPAAPTDSSTGDLAGSAPGVDHGQGASGGSQPATPSPASPVAGPGATPEAEAPEAEQAPVVTPVSQPTAAPETPAVPTGEEVPIVGEPPAEVEEPPVEEPEEGSEGEEAESEPLQPGTGVAVVVAE